MSSSKHWNSSSTRSFASRIAERGRRSIVIRIARRALLLACLLAPLMPLRNRVPSRPIGRDIEVRDGWVLRKGER